MEAGTLVTVTPKTGKKFDATFVSTKAGWTVVSVTGKDGAVVTSKHRASLVAVKGAKKVKPAKEKTPRVAKPKIDGEDNRLIKADLEHYILHDTKTPAGRRHVDIDDNVANKLREVTLDQAYAYAAKVCEVPEAELRTKYKALNPGMQRMNLGNRLRSVYRLGEKVQDGFAKHKKAA